MTLNKKFMMMTAALAVAGSVFTAPASAAPEPETKNYMTRLYKNSVDKQAENLLLKYFSITKLHSKAVETNNKELLAHTTPALAEAEKRLNNICIPLTQKLGIAYEEQLKKYPNFSDPLDPEFKRLSLEFDNSCDARLLPTIKVSATGKVTSDVQIDAKAYQREAHATRLASNQRVLDAIDEATRSSKTSGIPYAERMLRYAYSVMDAHEGCKAGFDTYERVLKSAKAPEIRRARSVFLDRCKPV